MLSRFVIVALLISSVFVSSGCREAPPEMGQVEGLVLVKGKPLSRLAVTFLPEPAADGKELPINAFAETDEQGKYQLKHFFQNEEGDGAPVGWHRVLIEDLRQTHLPQGQARPPQLISFDYSSPTTTPLHLEVKPGKQTIEIKIP